MHERLKISFKRKLVNYWEQHLFLRTLQTVSHFKMFCAKVN